MTESTALPAGVSRLIQPGARDIGAFSVRRALPDVDQRAIGPFVFFDQMGPAVLADGAGLDVRPHPHIGLATLTWLFDGEILHRDSLGSVQLIRPGEVNWMTAGSGIVHSERSPAERAGERPIFGLQAWLALPITDAETSPSFEHIAAADIPSGDIGGATALLIAGSAFGFRSPLQTRFETLFTQLTLTAPATGPIAAHAPERGLYVIDDGIAINDTPVAAATLAVLEAGVEPIVSGPPGARVVIFGGEPLDGPRHLWWNFVSHDLERLAQAKKDWQEGRFAAVPGDHEFIPLPEA